jgi:Ca2+-binding EF-hand superfamily protein
MLIGYLECEYDFENASSPMTGKENDLFTRLDQNQDGFLSIEEFTKPELFPSFDTNQDGRVDKKEGHQGMARLKKQKQARQKDRGGWRDWLDRLL